MADGEVEKAQTVAPGGDTIFGKILRKEIPTKFVYEDDQVLRENQYLLVLPYRPVSTVIIWIFALSFILQQFARLNCHQFALTPKPWWP